MPKGILKKKPSTASLKRKWIKFAETELVKVVSRARDYSVLKKQGPRGPWTIGIEIVGREAMRSLNSKYRKKNRPTDVLSFPTGAPFWEQGHLGDLVICLPVLR